MIYRLPSDIYRGKFTIYRNLPIFAIFERIFLNLAKIGLFFSRFFWFLKIKIWFGNIFFKIFKLNFFFSKIQQILSRFYEKNYQFLPIFTSKFTGNLPFTDNLRIQFTVTEPIFTGKSIVTDYGYSCMTWSYYFCPKIPLFYRKNPQNTPFLNN